MPYDRKSRRNYSTLTKFPRPKVENRLKTPPVPKRPLRFQVRTLIDKDFLRPNDWKFILHRRGPAGRPWVGLDPLEERAAQGMRGTLPERIIHKYLTDVMHFIAEVDFEFQSSLQGGRLDTGGIVADFLFRQLKIVLNPLGPTHGEYWRHRKDEEQIMALEELGYDVYMIEEGDVYDEQKLEWWMRRIFGWVHMGASDRVPQASYDQPNLSELDKIQEQVQLIYMRVREITV
jgi:very-short-patch-repair endonuclease